MMDIFGAIAIAMLILMGREYIKRGFFTEGVFLAFIIAVFKLYEPVRKFGQFNNNFQQALGASDQIFNFLDARDDVREKPGADKLPPFHQGIRFEHVYFGYAQARRRARGAARYQPRRQSRARWSPLSAPAVPARPRWSICCRASSTLPAAGC